MASEGWLLSYAMGGRFPYVNTLLRFRGNRTFESHHPLTYGPRAEYCAMECLCSLEVYL
jgi:hypothetical protein